MRRWLLLLALVGCKEPKPSVVTSPPAAPTVEPSPDATAYQLDLSERRQHMLEIEAAIPTKGRERIVVMMATWTPGSYLVREFARQVERVDAFGDADAMLRAEKVAKNRWSIRTDGHETLRLRYRVYVGEMSVRTSFVDDEYAVLNGASIFLADTERLDQPHEVVIQRPESWPDVATSLPKAGDRWIASNYDELVDTPIVIGKLERFDFEVAKTPHALVNVGNAGAFDGARAAEDVEAIVRTQIELFGGAPYERYLFLNVLSETRGGLEHLGSTVMMTSRFVTRDDEAYRNWLGLVSHELFHAWNGKRLRPDALGPFDYENEVYTSDLWFVEGFTSYYDDILVARSGLMNEKQWLKALSRNIASVEKRPGRRHQSLAEASYDAWIKFYRRDANSENATVSYYAQGAVVAFVLDAMIRAGSYDRTSLDDVMREAYRRHAQAGYTHDALLQVFEDVAGAEVRAEVQRLVHSTSPIEYGPALDWYGLTLDPATQPKPKAFLGVQTSGGPGRRVVVTQVVRGGAAYEAGVNVNDELIAIDGDRVEDLAKDLKGYAPGNTVTITVARRRRLLELKVKLHASAPSFEVRLAPRRGATEARRLARLLDG